MRITAIKIENYKRVREVAITPDADRSLILIGGKNGQGKSSTLDALTAAFGGKRAAAADPVRHGETEAAIYVELDGGKLTIDRVIKPDGTSVLEVRDPEGALKSPQTVLDKLVGARFLDPLAFLALAPKEQRAQLMKLIPDAKRIDDLDASRQRGFDRRTEIGRDLKRAEGELARLAEVKVEAPIDVKALSEELKTLTAKQHEGAKLAATRDQAVRATEQAVTVRVANTHAIERLERELAELRANEAPLADAVKKCEAAAMELNAQVDAAAKEWAAGTDRRTQLDADLARADEHNRAAFAAEAQNKRRAEAQAEVRKLEADVAKITEGLETVDKRKAEILAAAKLPVDGLTVGDTGVVLDGVPFEQASGAERLRVALALAMAASPGLADVWIRDGALLDEDSLKLVDAHAKKTGQRVWIERVGTKDDGVIVINDGVVVEKAVA